MAQIKNVHELLAFYQNAAARAHAIGDFSEAIRQCKLILKETPKSWEAHYQLAMALHSCGHLPDAIRHYEKVIALHPEFADAYCDLGVALVALERHNEGLKNYALALALDPDYAEAFYNRGIAFVALKKYEEAVPAFRQALVLKPAFLMAEVNLAAALCELGHFEEALSILDGLILRQPQFPVAYANRGHVRNGLKLYSEALSDFERAISLKPDYAEAFYNRGLSFQALQLFDEALASFDQAVAIKPDYAEAWQAKGLLLLLLANFDEGFALYEWRKRRKIGDRSFAKPLWSGSEYLSGRRILVHHEQGMGDTIQFCRYVFILKQMGAEVLFAPQRQLRKLLVPLNAHCQIVDLGTRSLQFDFHIPLLSLPKALGTRMEYIPEPGPYLRAEADRVEKWKRLIGDEGYKIGICWQGSVGPVDVGRSFPLRSMQYLCQVSGVRLISLHKGAGEAQLADLPSGMKVESLPADFDQGPDAFLDTAAVMTQCDLVISSDTAVAHLSGALGFKTWVALKQVPDWRWMLDRSDSPWYPSMRLFRQSNDGDWTSVFSQMSAALLGGEKSSS
jgi:tetratricopeptide (TPR) repeat protein